MPWYSCIVNEAGPAADGTETSTPVVYINLTDIQGSFTSQWFYVAEGSQNQMLSVALTAMNTNRQVDVATDYVPINVVGFPNRQAEKPSGAIVYPSITRMYLTLLSTALISPVFNLAGTYAVEGVEGPVITVNANYLSIDMSIYHRSPATGTILRSISHRRKLSSRQQPIRKRRRSNTFGSTSAARHALVVQRYKLA